MITVVTGLQFGDEGKGKIVDLLSKQANYIVRFHGGAGAGHTVKNKYGTASLHLVPCGIFYKKTRCVIANGVMLDPKILLEEIEALKNKGLEIKNRLFISTRAGVVLPYHKILDGIFDEAKGKLKTATTRRGNGPAHADKVSYYGILASDLLNKNTLEAKLSIIIPLKNKIIAAFGGHPINTKEVVKEYLEYGKKLKPYLANTFRILNQAAYQNKNILFEGAHGLFLDNDWGTYPNVTASSVLPSNIHAGAGINPKMINKAVGVLKAYSTRVDSGAGPFPTEIKGSLANELRTKGNEFGATTGRPRRIGWLDLVQVKFAIKLCGINEIALTKVDILAGLKEVLVCTAYKYGGKKVDYLDANAELLKKIKPVYKHFKGWESSSINNPNLKRYIKFIETSTKTKITIVSSGPDRKDALFRKL